MGRLRVKTAVWIVFAAFCAVASKAQLFVPSGVRFSTGPGATTRTFLAANSGFELTLDQPPQVPANPSEVTINATMSKATGDARKPLWTRTVKGWGVQYIGARDVYVSDAGDFFLMWHTNGREVLLCREGQTISLAGGTFDTNGLFVSSPEDIVAVDDLDGQKIVRIWDRDKNTWHVYRASDGEKVDVARSPEVIAKFNEATRAEILDRIFAARREALRRKVSQKAAPLAKIAAAAMGQNTNVVVSEIDYEFLTLLRNPDDRKWIEQLMDDDHLPFFGGFYESGDETEYSQADIVWARADWLLAIWDQKAKRGMIDRSQSRWLAEAEAQRFNLGKIFGRIIFPTPVNLYTPSYSPRAGATNPLVRVRLIPIDKATAHAEQIQRAIWKSPERTEDLFDEVTFSFATVRPGQYQLKVVWDKRWPFGDFENAGPGDYESALSPPIEVTAGGVVSNVVLFCTNRVAGGEAYYKADDVLRRKWKETGEVSQFTFVPDNDGRQDLFWRKAKFWTVATNATANTNFARVESIGTATYGALHGTDIPRPDSLDVLLERKPGGSTLKFDGASDLMIFDEHGCGFRQAFYFERKKSIRYTFFQFPRSATTWRLVGYSQPYDRKASENHVIFDYTLTNLTWNARRELIAKDLPFEIDLGQVKMKVTSVSHDSLEPHIEAKFYEHDQPTMDWFVREAFAGDAEGNLINPLEICREETAFRVTGYAGRADKTLKMPFEFVVPREGFK